MTQKNWMLVGTIGGGFVLAYGLGRLISGIPGGVVMLAVLLGAALVVAGIGRWIPTAPPWTRKFSGLAARSPLVSACIAIMLVFACFVAEVVRARVEDEKAQRTAAAQAKAEQSRKEAEAKALAEATKIARAEQLRASASANATRVRDELQAIEELLTQGQIDQAAARSATLTKEADDYRMLDPTPAEIAPLLGPIKALGSRVAGIVAVQGAVRDFALFKGEAEGMAQGGNDSSGWSEVVETYQKALDQLAILEGAGNEGRRLIPSSLNLRKERDAIKVNRDSARRQHKKAKDAESIAEQYTALCGAQPKRSAWDGEIAEVTLTVRQVAHDPDSIDVKNCTPPLLSKKDCWVTTCDVRGKNAFGAFVLSQRTFSISSRGVSEL
jgi:hypothetical protein